MCERSEPQSEPFVGQARSANQWSLNMVNYLLDRKRCLRYLENTFFEVDFKGNQRVKFYAFLCDVHANECSSKRWFKQDANL